MKTADDGGSMSRHYYLLLGLFHVSLCRSCTSFQITDFVFFFTCQVHCCYGLNFRMRGALFTMRFHSAIPFHKPSAYKASLLAVFWKIAGLPAPLILLWNVPIMVRSFKWTCKIMLLLSSLTVVCLCWGWQSWFWETVTRTAGGHGKQGN